MESRRKEIEGKIDDLRAKKAELEGEIIKKEKSLHLDSGDLALSKKKYEELEEKALGVQKDINDIQNKISVKNKELAKLKIERQQLRGKISSLRDPTLVAQLSTFEEKHRELNEEILQLDAEIKNISTQINDIFRPEIDKTESILKQIEKEKIEFDKEKGSISAEIKKQGAVLAEKEKEAKEFYSKFKELFNKRATTNEEIGKSGLDISRINDKSRDVEIKNNTLSIKNAELHGELAGLKEEYNQYEGVELDSEKNEEQLKYQIQKFEKMKEEIGSVNMRALEIYEEIEKEYNKLLEKKDPPCSQAQDQPLPSLTSLKRSFGIPCSRCHRSS
jgi:chromosome segregation protein